jgi:hypothetical protein
MTPENLGNWPVASAGGLPPSPAHYRKIPGVTVVGQPFSRISRGFFRCRYSKVVLCVASVMIEHEIGGIET